MGYRAEHSCRTCGAAFVAYGPNSRYCRVECKPTPRQAYQRRKDAILDRDGRICHWCQGVADTVDHLLPQADGGGDEPANLVAACRSCNSSRGRGRW